MNKMGNDEFQCAVCDNIYKKKRSDEEAENELREMFGNYYDLEECELVCDDCYNRMNNEYPIEEFVKIQKIVEDFTIKDYELYEIERKNMCTKISIDDLRKYFKDKLIETIGTNEMDYRTMKTKGHLIFNIIEEAISKYDIIE